MKTSDKVGAALGLAFGVGNMAALVAAPHGIGRLLLATVGGFLSFYGAIGFFARGQS